MIAFLTDEDFNGRIVRGLRRRNARIDLLRIQDVYGVPTTHDREVLEFAATAGRVVLSHDVNTMSYFAYERINQGMPMPGVLLVPQQTPLGVAIDDILIAADSGEMEDWNNQVRFIRRR